MQSPTHRATQSKVVAHVDDSFKLISIWVSIVPNKKIDSRVCTEIDPIESQLEFSDGLELTPLEWIEKHDYKKFDEFH